MSTPPPAPARAHTPPTPLHGGKHDAYEPFSPRRSSRIHQQQHMPMSADKSQASTAHAAPGKRKSTFRRTSSQTFSPPSSPVSPQPHTVDDDSSLHLDKRRKRTKLSPPDDDVDSAEPAASLQSKPSRPAATLPTPAKTPRKRHVSDFRATARVLFPGNTMHPDDEVPTPRQSRKAQRANAVTLESFAQAPEQGNEQIEIYTDSKDRVPELDETEDNPFLELPSSSRRRAAAERVQPQRKSKTGMGKEVDEAVENDEGMVYVFRGKKIFRRFTSPRHQSGAQPDFGDGEVRRAVGAAARGRFSRREVKPRLLFPSQDQADHTDEEEAMTDIETPDSAAVSTPRKGLVASTPPTTAKSLRYVDALAAEDDKPMSETGGGTARKGKSPFDLWQRSKAGAASCSPVKRAEAGTRSSKRHAGGADAA